MAPELAELAQASANSTEFETHVLALLERAIGCDVAYFSTRGAEAFPTTMRLDRATIAVAITRAPAYLEDFLPVKRAALAARGVAVDTDVLGTAGVERTRYYRDLMVRVGAKHSLMAYVPWRGEVVAQVLLGRGGSGFSAEEVGRIEALLPALGVARAAFGLPRVEQNYALAPASHFNVKPGLWARLGLSASPAVLVTEPFGRGALTVRDCSGFREMVASDHEGGELVWTRAALRDASESGWPYIELFHVAAAWARRRERALFVGAGGAVALHQFARVYPGLAIDLVDREPRVIELARTYFELAKIPNLRVHVAEGARFVACAADGSWDTAIIDAFDAGGAGLAASAALFRQVSRALRAGGTMAFNWIGALGGPELQRVVRAVRASFERVRLLPVLANDEVFSPHALRNVVLVARRTG